MKTTEGTQGLKLDAYGYQERGAQQRMEDAHGFDIATGCFVVADGVGQRQGGQHAAREVVKQVVDVTQDRRHLDPPAALRHAMHMSALVVAHEQEARSLPCGTTVAALLLRGGRAFITWCGDVRVYRLRVESITGTITTWRPSLLTRDHRDAAGTLLRNLGSRRGGDSAAPEYHETDAQPGDVFALVTDGVWEALGGEGVSRTMMESHVGSVATLNTRWVAEELVHRALERGSKDNLTALVVRVSHG